MKRWINWLACFAGGGMLLFGLFIRVEHLRGERALKARLNSLAAQGEILSVTALTPKRPAPDQNLFLDLLPLTNRLGAIVTNLAFAPPLLRFAAPGRAIAVAQLDEWKAEGAARGDWKLLASALEPAGEIGMENCVGCPGRIGFPGKVAICYLILSTDFAGRRSYRTGGALGFNT